ncbi:hypothetical protein NQ315_008101 [Exocentrus adspersus]|uniref:Uncharacterized protein n=1 Tax=Exocentrus adspersus TaxID=1586481 RepID=A0AAV8VW86_9CUCU|nr:hypothetical protein NQ315_008101 [Exocentrus adspersus]
MYRGRSPEKLLLNSCVNGEVMVGNKVAADLEVEEVVVAEEAVDPVARIWWEWIRRSSEKFIGSHGGGGGCCGGGSLGGGGGGSHASASAQASASASSHSGGYGK